MLIIHTAIFSQNSISIDKLLPKEIINYMPGMPYNDFATKFNTITPDEETFSFRYEITIPINNETIKNVTLYFDKDATQPLYEYIIEFNSEENLHAFTSRSYEEKNEDQKWLWKLNDGPSVKAWTFDTSLVIAIIYPNTEWDTE